MRKLFTVLMLASVCMSAAAKSDVFDFDVDKDVNISVFDKDSKWDLGLQIGFLYNYNKNTDLDLRRSGFGFELNILELRYQAWKTGYLTFGILNIYFDNQYLYKGKKFTSAGIINATDGEGHLCDYSFSIPVGVTQKLGRKVGVSLYVLPGIGLVNYVSSYMDDSTTVRIRHKDTIYDVDNRVDFRLDMKGVLWYGDLGLELRYRPVKAKNNWYATNIFSVGAVIRF